MAKAIDITIKNQLTAEKRAVNVFQHSTRTAHLISHDSSVTLSLQNSAKKDYLHISVDRGPGYLWNDCLISLPSWVDFDFSSQGKLGVTHSNGTNRTILRIPPGLPGWELKITMPAGSLSILPLNAVNGDNVTISDNGSGEVG